MAEGQARYSLMSLSAISTFLYFPLALLGQTQPWEKEWSSQSLEPGASKRRGYNMGQNPGSALGLSRRKAESNVSSQTRHTDLSSLVSLSSAGEMKYQGWSQKVILFSIADNAKYWDLPLLGEQVVHCHPSNLIWNWSSCLHST